VVHGNLVSIKACGAMQNIKKNLSWNRDCFVAKKQERLLAMTAQRLDNYLLLFRDIFMENPTPL
jgi:hypothetical protein